MALPLPKLLIVGSLDRLDATLEAGHMQGRFRLELVAHVGHYIHEDLPEKVAEAIGQFPAKAQAAGGGLREAHELAQAATPGGERKMLGERVSKRLLGWLWLSSDSLKGLILLSMAIA